MTEAEIRDIVREVAQEILELDADELTDEVVFENVGSDSIQRLELVSVLRERLGAPYTLEEELRINSVRSAVEVTCAVLAK